MDRHRIEQIKAVFVVTAAILFTVAVVGGGIWWKVTEYRAMRALSNMEAQQ